MDLSSKEQYQVNNMLVFDSYFFRDFYKWSDETFGPERTPDGPLRHLKEEADEAIAKPEDISEFADIFILLVDALRLSGHTPAELEEAVYNKFEVIKERKYQEPDADGVCRHVK